MHQQHVQHAGVSATHVVMPNEYEEVGKKQQHLYGTLAAHLLEHVASLKFPKNQLKQMQCNFTLI